MGEKKQVQGNAEKDLFPWAPAERKLALPFAGNPGTHEKGLEDLKNAHPAKRRCHRGRKNTLLRVRSACLMRWSPQWKARWCGKRIMHQMAGENLRHSGEGEKSLPKVLL